MPTTNYPTTLDDGTSLPNPGSSDLLASATPNLQHNNQHDIENDAIKALEAKVGITNSLVATSHEYQLNNVKGPFTFANEAARIAFKPPTSAIGSWAFVTSTGKVYCLFNVNSQTGFGWWSLIPSYLQKPNDVTLTATILSSGGTNTTGPDVSGTNVSGMTAAPTIAGWSDSAFPQDIQPSKLITTNTSGATLYWWRVPVTLPGGFAGGTYVITLDVAASTNLGSFALMDGSKAPFGSNWGAYTSGSPVDLSPFIESNAAVTPVAGLNGQGAPVWGSTGVGGNIDTGAFYSQPLNGIVCTNIPAGATTMYLYFHTTPSSGSGNKGFVIIKRIYFNQ